MRSLIALVAVGLILAVAGTAQADSVVFDRALPTINVNAPDSSRSNVDWTDSYSWDGVFLGDNFNIAGTGQTVINSLSVWVTGPVGSTTTATLWTGTQDGGSPAVVVAPGSTNATISPATYANGQSYLIGEKVYPISEVTFTNLNWTVNNGTFYDFGVTAQDLDGAPIVIYLLASASDPVLSGSPQDGADGVIYGWNAADGTLNEVVPTAAYWDKPSDISVQITGDPIPEPITMAGLMMGIGGLVTYVRRRARK